MQLHELGIAKKKNQRVGRGGKRGTTAGRGTKGQRSRAGRRIRPAARDLIMRLPKRRGVRNKPLTARPLVLNLADFAAPKIKTALENELVTVARLRAVGLIPPSLERPAVKILGNGDIDYAFTVGSGIAISASAKTKLEKAGGKAPGRIPEQTNKR